MHQLGRPIAMLLLPALGAACGSADLQQSGRRHQATHAMWAAEQAGAEQDPRSARLLELARREMMYAQAAADNGDERNAELLLDRSEADSVLALQVVSTREEREKTQQAWEEFSASQLER